MLETFDYYKDVILIALLGALVLLVLLKFELGTAAEWSVFVAILVTHLFVAFASRIMARKKELAFALFVSYLASGREAELDAFLLKMIGGRWELVKFLVEIFLSDSSPNSSRCRL